MHLHCLSVHDDSLIQRLGRHHILEAPHELELISIDLLNVTHSRVAESIGTVVLS